MFVHLASGAPVASHHVIQHHSLLAQGNMQLSVIHKQQVLTTPVSIYATQRDMQLALNALSKDFTVSFWLLNWVFVCVFLE